MSTLVRRARRFVPIALVAITSPTLRAQATGRALSAEDYYRVKTVGTPDLSPDAKWVAFTVATRVEATNDATSEVWLVAADGSSQARRVSADGVNGTAPAWLDDGRLRFSSAGKAMVLDPSAPDRVTEADAAASAGGRGGGGRGGRGGGGGRGGRGGGGGGSMESPDGKWTAVVRDMPLPKREKVYESEFAKRHEERFKGVSFDWMDFQRDAAPFPLPNRVDPDVNPPQEFFLAPAGGAEKQLTHLGLRPAGANWSHDGTTLVFTADSGYRNEMKYGRSDVWSVTVDGVVKKLTSSTDLSYAGARYSPDGKWIVATRSTSTDAVIAKKMDNGGPVDLVVFPAGGGTETNLTATWDYLPSAPFWSNDGKYIYFTGGIGGTTHLFRVAPTGGAVEQVTKGERRLTGFSYDRAQTKMTYQVGRFEAPSEIYVANLDGSGEKQLTHVFDPFTREIGLRKAARRKFKSVDGTPI
jgi:Tol biopolymer transport system component